MKKSPVSLIVGVALAVITLIIYGLFLGEDFFEAPVLVTLLGVLLAEAVATFIAFASKGEPRKVAASLVSAAMVPVAVILSVKFISDWSDEYFKFCGIYFIFFIVIMTVAFLLFSVNSQKKEENEQLQTAKNNILNMRKLVKVIMVNPAAAPYEQKLYALEEKLHFSNDNVVSPQDDNIYNMISFLHSNISSPDFDVNAYIDSINNAIDTRNIMTQRTI